MGLGEQLRLLERFLEAAQTSREPRLSGGERGPHLARVGVGLGSGFGFGWTLGVKVRGERCRLGPGSG